MKILITGAAGYIGSFLCNEMLRHGHSVIGIDRLDYHGDSLLPVLGHDRFEFVSLDLSEGWDLAKMAPLSAVDFVIHAAGVVGEPACSADSDWSYRSNVVPLQILPDSLKCLGGRFINLSTCSVYGPTDREVDESYAPAATGVYATQKIEVERLVLEFGGTNLRLGTAYGVSPRMRFDTLINALARDTAWGRSTTLYGPDDWRPFLSLNDLSAAIIALLGAPPITGLLLNVVSYNLTKSQLHRLFDDAPLLVRQPGVSYRVDGALCRRMLGLKHRPGQLVQDITRLKLAARMMHDPMHSRWSNA